MKKRLSLLTVLLCLCLLMAGCGNQEEDKSPTTPGVEPLPDLKVEECYDYFDHGNGTYSYTVTGRSGGTVYSVKETTRTAAFTAVNEDVLLLSGQLGVGHLVRWATFCNIEKGQVSRTFGGYLASVDTIVACVEQRTDAYHVFVCDAFDPDVYQGVYEMEGLSIVEGQDPVKNFALDDKGILRVTYPTEDGDTTMEIDLNAAATQDFPISEAEALELVQQHLGIYNGDRDPETGFLMSWVLEQSPTAEMPLYRFLLQLSVETNGEPSHFSTINWLSVDANTGLIIA